MTDSAEPEIIDTNRLLQTFELDLEEYFPNVTSNQIPLYGDFPIDTRETAPFLVSSNKSVVWISSPMKDVVRAVIRNQGLDEFPMQVVDAIAHRGISYEWGNVHPWSKEGIAGACEYLAYYGLTNIEMLCHPEDRSRLEDLVDSKVKVNGRLAKGTSVVVPRDRSYLGWLAEIKGMEGVFVSVLHNPSRAISILRDIE